jgi:hypothetical protein
MIALGKKSLTAERRGNPVQEKMKHEEAAGYPGA